MTKVRVVLADHERLFREGLKGVLAELGPYEVVGETGEGPAIADLIAKREADLLITEMDLPYWPGTIVTRNIHKMFPEVPILVLTRNSTEALLLEAIQAGAAGVLLKTASKQQLAEALQTVTETDEVYLHAEFPVTIIRQDEQPEPAEAPLAASRYQDLSPREREVLKLLVHGNRNLEVADQLGISVKTVEIHRARIMEKLHLHRLAHLVRYAVERGLVKRPATTPKLHMPFKPRRGRPAGSRNKPKDAVKEPKTAKASKASAGDQPPRTPSPPRRETRRGRKIA